MALVPNRIRAASALILAFALSAPIAAHAAGMPADRLDGKSLNIVRLPDLDQLAMSGEFEVPEDRALSNGRHITLNVLVLPAFGDSVASDALTFLAGGGVVPATRYARFLARAFRTLRQHHDIVLVDQRGTWNSTPLACEGDSSAAQDRGALPADPCSVGDTKKCRDALQSHADLRAYTTAAAVLDLDAVRAWLGYEQLDLYGASYGTKVAQAYAKRFPERVRTIVLHGVVPLDTPIELDYAASAEATLARVFQACEADSACRAAYPNVAKEFRELLTRKPVTVADTLGMTPRTLIVTDRLVRDFVQQVLGTTAVAIGTLPRTIHAAYTGDYRPLARAWLGEGPPPPPAAPRGVFRSILCSESIARVDKNRVAAATRGTFFGDYSIRRQICECAEWPKASLSEQFWQPAKSSAPALVLTGELDAITPPRYGEHVAKELGNATHLVLPARSHADLDPCVGRLIESFLLQGGMAGADTSCLGGTRLRFATRPLDSETRR